ncbi:protein dispatched homolog 2 [Polypterus senegalus]|nr:protein dispatched homolog 2 [Polypterus senegalus]
MDSITGEQETSLSEILKEQQSPAESRTRLPQTEGHYTSILSRSDSAPHLYHQASEDCGGCAKGSTCEPPVLRSCHHCWPKAPTTGNTRLDRYTLMASPRLNCHSVKVSPRLDCRSLTASPRLDCRSVTASPRLDCRTITGSPRADCRSVTESPRLDCHSVTENTQLDCHSVMASPHTDCHSMTASTRLDCRSVTASPCPKGPPIAVRTAHSCNSSPGPSCRDRVHCHWLQGSQDSGNHQPVQHHVVTVRQEKPNRIPRSYSQLIADWPIVLLSAFSLLLIACSLAGFLIGPLPDFSDPLLGFEPRGTQIGKRLCAWKKLQEDTGPDKPLSLFPKKLTGQGSISSYSQESDPLDKADQRQRRMVDWNFIQDAFFCDSPGEKYAQLVYRSGNSASLWSLQAIRSMCEMEQTWIRSHAHFQDLCVREGGGQGGECCPSWSLGNYLAVLSNATSCLGLSSWQVLDSLKLLRGCAPYYHDGSLGPSCGERGKPGRCSKVPEQCKRSSAVYQILHYLVDKDFLGPQTINYQVPSLKYSLLFLPVQRGNSMLDIYLDNLEGRDLTYGNTTITGMDLGIKQRLFHYYLARDSVYPVLAAVTLFFVKAFYIRSVFLSAMSTAAALGSLMAAYFFYKIAFGLSFFPFLNLAVTLILLGSCANQAFVFTDFWNLQLFQKPSLTLEKRVSRSLQEVGYLMTVSGLTSSAAFYSGYMSSITTIRCFAIYLGTASLISTLFAVVWLPCVLVLRERYTVTTAAEAPRGKTCCILTRGGFWETSSRKRCLFSLVRRMRELRRGLADTSDLLFQKILPCGVVKFRYIWVCWFAAMAAGGTYITCIDPGMKLQALEGVMAQLFRSSHPFERYDSEYRHQFMFQRIKTGEERPVSVTLVWGVLPVDNGDHLNPKSNGSLMMDSEFNMSSPEAQTWLLGLCSRLRNQTFYSPPTSSEEEEEWQGDSVCFMEHLVKWISSRQCSQSDNEHSLCCSNMLPPFLPRDLQHCLGMMAAERQAGGLPFDSGGPRFDSEGRVAALVLEFRTTHFYSFNYSRTMSFYKEIDTWFEEEISRAPAGLHKGFFVSYLTLFDLQQCLSSETLLVTGFSIILVFAVFLLTTWNVPLSLYGAIAVGGTVFVTIGLMVLLEWQLSGVEALFISAAAGLSVDFAGNYCVSYSLSPHSDRLGRVAHSLKKMGCPAAVGAGAFFCAGVFMLPSTALVFRKLGIFLLLVKCVACGFATFFFQSICCFFGPQKNCGQILWPCNATDTYKEDPVPGLLSPSSATCGGTSNYSVNGAFGCGGRSRARRSFGKGAGEAMHIHQGQQRQRVRPSGGGRDLEQYELQPLARHLSDSFENSTCTSKLSNRPSVLSEDIQFRSLTPQMDSDRRAAEDDYDNEDAGNGNLQTCPPPALQTSSPYKENVLRSVLIPAAEITQNRLLCRRCRGQKQWNPSLSSSSSLDDIVLSCQLPDGDHQHPVAVEGASGILYKRHQHRCLLYSQSQSSFEGLEDSNETCLSEVDTGLAADTNVEQHPGHLNGKRDTLRLALKETVFDTGLSSTGRGWSGHTNAPVIIPNSKPDLPDVWVKRENDRSNNS